MHETFVRTMELSRGGFSFLYARYIHPDSRISARFDVLPDRPAVVGQVRSCVPLHGTQHRVGVAIARPNA